MNTRYDEEYLALCKLQEFLYLLGWKHIPLGKDFDEFLKRRGMV